MSIRKGRLTSQGVIAAPVNLNFPVGTILPFAGPSTQIPEGFLLCNGAEINREDYVDLFSVIDTKWGSGDGSTTFRIPTTQGLLLRGVAYGSGNDPDRASRNAVQTGGQTGDEVGSFQNWRVQSHQHVTQWRTGQDTPNGLVVGGFGCTAGTLVNAIQLPSNGNNAQSTNAEMRGHNGTNPCNDSSPNSSFETSFQNYQLRTSLVGSNQTVGQNVYVNFIIKY